MMTEPQTLVGLVFLVTVLGLTALIGTVAHAKGGARGYARGHLAGHQKGLEQGRAEGRAAGIVAAATANPQVIRTPHVAHWERTRVSDPQPTATRLQPATVPAKPSPTPRQKTQDGRGTRWGAEVVHTQELLPTGRHAATSTEVLPAVTPKKVL